MPNDLIAGHNLVVYPTQLMDQWMNELTAGAGLQHALLCELAA